MQLNALLILLLVMVGCATRTPATDNLLKKSDLTSAQIKNVPNIIQKDKQCGPASLAMIMQFHDKNISETLIAKEVFKENLGGTYRTDLISFSRQQEMMVFHIKSFSAMLTEVAAGNPVLVFQNNGFSFYPKYHFSIVTGFDLETPEVTINTGEPLPVKQDMRMFERSWILGGYWAVLILPEDKISATASETEHIQAASYLEEMGFNNKAEKAYQTILKRWPQSYLALLGLANISYSQKDIRKAEDYLLKASNINSDFASIWHNLALIQAEQGKFMEARKSASKAIQSANPEEKLFFQTNLAKLL